MKYQTQLFLKSGAKFSNCRKYRYTLFRIWDESKSHIMFIGLNPSTANEIQDDPTVRRCLYFAKSWGYGGLFMLNLFAYRSTYPALLKQAINPVGPDNDFWLQKIAEGAGIVIAAWGIHGILKNRDKEVISLIRHLDCLGTTKDGYPKHPLYLRGDTAIFKYN